jgi:outer membrane receptor protein involved in Fe transport
VDYNISQRTRLSARYINNDSAAEQPYTGGGNVQLSDVVRRFPGRNGAISLWHSFSPTLTNEFIFGPSSSEGSVGPEDEKATRRANHITFPLLFPEANPKDYIPAFQYGGIANIAAFPFFGDLNTAPARNRSHTFDFIDNVAKAWDSHLIKTGVYLQRSRLNRHAGESVGSLINFTSNANNPLNTGHPFANALLGIYNTYQQSNGSPRAYYRFTNLEGYIQDNWKVTPRLSLDYGLRIAWYQPQYERRLQTGFFNPEL